MCCVRVFKVKNYSNLYSFHCIFIYPSNVNDRQSTAKRASNSKNSVDPTNISVGKPNENCYCCCHFYADNSTDTRHEIATHSNRFQFSKCKSSPKYKFRLHIGTLHQISRWIDRGPKWTDCLLYTMYIDEQFLLS